MILPFSNSLNEYLKETLRGLFPVIEGMGVNPYAEDIEKMKGEEDVWRRRVGAYRIFYELMLRKTGKVSFPNALIGNPEMSKDWIPAKNLRE